MANGWRRARGTRRGADEFAHANAWCPLDGGNAMLKFRRMTGHRERGGILVLAE